MIKAVPIILNMNFNKVEDLKTHNLFDKIIYAELIYRLAILGAHP